MLNHVCRALEGSPDILGLDQGGVLWGCQNLRVPPISLESLGKFITEYQVRWGLKSRRKPHDQGPSNHNSRLRKSYTLPPGNL